MNDLQIEELLREVRELRREASATRKIVLSIFLLMLAVVLIFAGEARWLANGLVAFAVIAPVIWMLYVWQAKNFYKGAAEALKSGKTQLPAKR